MPFCVDAGSRSWSDNELNLKADVTQVNPIKMAMGSSLKKSSSCNLVKFFSKEDDTYSKSCNTELSLEKVKPDENNF